MIEAAVWVVANLCLRWPCGVRQADMRACVVSLDMVFCDDGES